jgi:hypothetical protein
LISNDDLFSFFFAPCRRVGDGGLHHFFGYYNKSNWDKGNRLLAAQQTPWMDIYLTPEVKATIGYFDTQDGDRFHAVGETGAWNFQMGSQLQWLDGAPGRKLIYNDRTGDMSARYPGFGAVVVDVDTQERRVLPMPVYVVAPSSAWALSVNYRRLYITHETIGYSEPGQPLNCLWRPQMTASGAWSWRKVIPGCWSAMSNSRHSIMCRRWTRPSTGSAISRSTRLLRASCFCIDGERVKDETCFLHRLITMNPDGSDMRLLECSDHPLPQLADDFDPSAVGTFDYEKSQYQISHPCGRTTSTSLSGGHMPANSLPPLSRC